MVANVEKMTRAKGTERSWHGEENQTDTQAPDFDLNLWKQNAGLDWNAFKQPLLVPVPAGFIADASQKTAMYGDQLFLVCPDQIALMRDKDNRILGYHSPEYEVVQPSDTIEQLNDIISVDERFHWDTAGSLDGGRKIWALARFESELDVLGEPHKPYLLASTSFDGSMATTLAATMVRVVCQNTLRMSLILSRPVLFGCVTALNSRPMLRLQCLSS
jgi:phage/plasmid-like protein (TIGR03299 family)